MDQEKKPKTVSRMCFIADAFRFATVLRVFGEAVKNSKRYQKSFKSQFLSIGILHGSTFLLLFGCYFTCENEVIYGSGTFLECGDDGVNACCFLQRHAFVWAFLGLSSQVFLESNNQHPIPPSRGWWSQQLPRLSQCLICAPFGKCHEESDLDSAQNIPIFDARYSRLFFVGRCFAHGVSAIALPLDIQKKLESSQKFKPFFHD